MKTNLRGKVRNLSDIVVSGPLLQPAVPVGAKREKSTAKQRLLRRILAMRDSIEADKGILSESYPLLREDRGR
jgi:hypothetical protein